MAKTKVIEIKRGDKIYLYEDTPVWDKAKKHSTHIRKMIGQKRPDGTVAYNSSFLMREENKSLRSQIEQMQRATPPSGAQATGEEESGEGASPGVASTALVGDTMLLQALAERTGLEKCLVDALGAQLARQVLAMAYFVVREGKAFCHAEHWLDSRGLGSLGLTSQRISELEQRLDSGKRNAFYKRWYSHVGKGKTLMLDLTSVSGYGRRNPFLERGYNRDKEDLEQVNLELIVTEDNHVPVLFNMNPGSLSDRITPEGLLARLDGIDASVYGFMGDRAFFTKDNVALLMERGIKFVMPIPSSYGWYYSLIDSGMDRLAHPDNLIYHEDDYLSLFGTTLSHDIPWLNGVEIHLFSSPYTHDTAVCDLVKQVNQARTEILEGKPNKSHSDVYKKYLIIEKDDEGAIKKVTVNTERLERDKKYAGYWMLADSLYGTPAGSHAGYRNRNYDEVGFDDVKNLHDAVRMRNHTPETIEGKFFIVFIAQILENQLRNDVKAIPATKRKHMTGREMLDRLTTYSKTVFDNKKTAFSVPTKHQRMIFDLFKISYWYKGKMRNQPAKA